MKSRLQSGAGRTELKENSTGEHTPDYFLGHSVQVWLETSATDSEIEQYFFKWAAVSLFGWLPDMSVNRVVCLSPPPIEF